MISQKAARMLLEAAHQAYWALNVYGLSDLTRGMLDAAIKEAGREQELTPEAKAILKAGHDYVVRNSE